MWNCLRKKKRLEREFIVSQVLARHADWFPVHNRGREAPAEALAAWKRKVQPLSENELILLIADNRARNRLLGKNWLPLMQKEKKTGGVHDGSTSEGD